MELSSASEFLEGFPYRGRLIARIEKRSGGNRHIVFHDGTSVTVKRKVIHSLAKFKGLQVYRHRLLTAPTEETAARILERSTSRQFRLRDNYRRDLREALPIVQPSIQRAIKATIRRIMKIEIGSPLIGMTPATSFVPPNWGPQHDFAVIKDTGRHFITIRDPRTGKPRVVLVDDEAA